MSDFTVYVVGHDSSTDKMFKDEGWNVVKDFKNVLIDLVCFTGGHDVHPFLYGESINGAHEMSMERDLKEVFVYLKALQFNIPMVGICRGGQFLNVMNGGKLIQDLSHFMGGLQSTDHPSGGRVHVDHHQGILVEKEGANTGTVLVKYKPEFDHDDDITDIAVVAWYEGTECLCFQPHPEWGHGGTKDMFFEFINDFILVDRT